MTEMTILVEALKDLIVEVRDIRIALQEIQRYIHDMKPGSSPLNELAQW